MLFFLGYSLNKDYHYLIIDKYFVDQDKVNQTGTDLWFFRVYKFLKIIKVFYNL